MEKTDTIAAIATPIGLGSISVIKVSGEDAIKIVDSVYRGEGSLLGAQSHTVHYGHIICPHTETTIDEVLISLMRAPRTMTREHVLEISTHGGLVLVKAVLEVLLASGARLAEPGEFTKRAFLNGRIDLSQAEAIADLVSSKTDKAASIALEQVKGSVFKTIATLRDQILETLASLAVDVDYPEYEDEEIERTTPSILLATANDIGQKVSRAIEMAKSGRIYREGIKVVIVGRPNVGKSSLMNMWLQENRAIVTNIPGTTRDTIEENANIRGIPVVLSDTAGIRETEDIVERMGIERAYLAAEQADLLLYLLDHGQPFTEDDYQQLLALSKQDSKLIIVINKADVPSKLVLAEVANISAENISKQTPIVQISVQQREGIDELEHTIEQIMFGNQLSVMKENGFVTNARHIDLLRKTKQSLDAVVCGVQSGVPLDIVEIDFKNAWVYLGEITGETTTEDLLDQIFSKFCLGK